MINHYYFWRKVEKEHWWFGTSVLYEVEKYNILVKKNSQMDWNRAHMTRHYIRYRIQLFPTIKKYLSWGSRAKPHSWVCFNQQESVVTPTLHCKPLICLKSLFEIFHIFCEGSAGRDIITKDKPNADLLANFSRRPHPVLICPGAPAAEVELWNISQVESCPGELPDHHSERTQTHLQPYNKSQSFKSALKAPAPPMGLAIIQTVHSEEVN